LNATLTKFISTVRRVLALPLHYTLALVHVVDTSPSELKITKDEIINFVMSDVMFTVVDAEKTKTQPEKANSCELTKLQCSDKKETQKDESF